MKKYSLRFLSIVLSFLLCFSVCFGINIPVQAEKVNYVYAEGKYIKNWGVREETATFLSQNAEAFYLDNDTSYAELSVLNGSSSTGGVPSSALYIELQDLMESNHTNITSYGETRYLYQYTDCQNSGKTSNKISSFYSGADIGPDWDSGATWNREHTWPNSKGDGDGENDIMMLRPTAKSENSSRGNTAYGQSSGYYNPNAVSGGKHDLRGDVARIMLYQHVRWGQSKLFGSSGVIESKDVLLDWIEEDPVDTWELGRNDSVESITGTRNVFVDYPELAFILFGEQVPTDYTSPSGGAADGSTTTPNPDPEEPEVGDPAADSTLTIEEAIALGASKAHNTYTEAKYYVTGKIVEVYGPQYGNMRITDDNGNILTLYGTWSADGETRYDALEVKPIAGDTITVYGIIGQYNDTPQLKNGWIVDHIKGEGEAPVAPETAEEILADAEKLEPGQTLPYEATLTGTIVSIDTEYSEQYGNITVTIEVDNTVGKTIQCYRLKGEGADALAVGDKITVTGYIINYQGKIQFNTGATFVLTDDNTPDIDVPDIDVPDLDAPTVGTPYKFGMIQGNVSNTDVYYIDGSMNGYYMNTTTDVSAAVDVYIEETTGGYYFYSVNEKGTKFYINMVVSGTHVNGQYAATASTVYTYDTQSQTLIADIDGVPYWFGTRNDMSYTTVGPCKTEYSGFYCKLYPSDTTSDDSGEDTTPDVPEDLTYVLIDTPVVGTPYKFGMIQGNVSNTDVYYIDGAMNGYYMNTTTDVSAAVDVYIEETTGGYYFYSVNEKGTKFYINMVVSGTHVNGQYAATASTVYTYDTNSKTLIANISGIPYWFGTRNDMSYTTVGPCKTEYAGFYCQFYGEEPETPELPAPPVNNDPAADSILTIEEAIALGASKAHNTYTEAKYYVTGKIVEVYGPQYGNMRITDENGNILTLYGTWSADGQTRYDALEVKPIVGDTIIVYGIIGQYNDTPQLKNGWIVDHVKGEGEAPVAPETAEEILADAEKLEPGQTLPYEATLTGTIVSIDTEYSEQYGNITVTIEVDNTVGKTIQCYRLKGEGADALAVGDKITVTGYIINYNGIIQFAADATFVLVDDGTPDQPTVPGQPDFIAGDINDDGNVNNKDLGLLMQHLNGWDVEIVLDAADVNGDNAVNNKDYGLLMQYLNGWDVELNGGSTSDTLTIVTDQDKILEDAFSLGQNEKTPYIAQLTGKVISIDTVYDPSFENITVSIKVGDKTIQCYRMKGNGVAELKVGDTITVQGVIKNYYPAGATSGKIEFAWDADSQTEVIMISRIPGIATNTVSIVDNPVVGVAYKFGFYQEALDGTYFAAGYMDGFYMATTTDVNAAIDVYLENANGGYYLYTIVGGVKKYMNIELNGTHVNAVFRDTPDAVFTYDTTLKTLVVSITKDGITKQYAFGTHSIYYTIGTAQTTMFGYFCHFYK